MIKRFQEVIPEIINELSQFYTDILHSGQKGSAMATTVIQSMSIHIANDDNVWYDNAASSFTSRIYYLALKTVPMVKNIEFILNNDGELFMGFLPIPEAENKSLKNFTGDNKGMTEISPINATMGEISTPNTKSNFNATNSQTEIYTNFDYHERKIRMLQSDYMNLTTYLHSIFSQIIVERHTIF